MKIIYTPNQSQWNKPPNLPFESYISLSQNEWDDFGDRTSLNIKLVVKGEEIVINSILKIKIENESYTYHYLNKLRKEGWDGIFPIPNVKYISLANNILFYQALQAKFEIDEIKEILSDLNDLIYLENFSPESENLILKLEPSFYSSLLRESGEKLSYREGYNIITEKKFNINDFDYYFFDKFRNKKKIRFNLNSSQLPYDINILIGPNGVGKSHLIKEILKDMLSLNLNKDFDKNEMLTSFNLIILISYSLFEEFDVDLNRYKKIQDKNIYKYFGFRRRKEDGETIGISRNTPSYDSAVSFLKCISDDIYFDYIEDWESKIETIFEVLNKAFNFDEILLTDKEKNLLNYSKLSRRFQADEHKLKDDIDFSKGIIFRFEGNEVKLSSGQRFFTFMVINILAYIKKNTIVFIDEPELFLHPLLEIELFSLLKDILTRFNSKAILATHSLTLAREVPAKCVHVMRFESNEIFINRPPFETFGGDMQRISTYVFGDNSVTKPFEEWLSNQLSTKTQEQLINDLGKEINEEMLVKILNHGENNV
ncbi:AAA family ATPase [Acinetobacter junii]|uniref:AAA family ATPase n=1 Tax=Acinetobacter junii TaxID=40215 RepID=UPI003A88A072